MEELKTERRNKPGVKYQLKLTPANRNLGCGNDDIPFPGTFWADMIVSHIHVLEIQKQNNILPSRTTADNWNKNLKKRNNYFSGAGGLLHFP